MLSFINAGKFNHLNADKLNIASVVIKMLVNWSESEVQLNRLPNARLLVVGSKLKFARRQDIGKPEIGNLHSVGQVLVKNSQEISDNQDKISVIITL